MINKSKPKKDKLDGVAIMRLVDACRIKDTNRANRIMAEIEEFQYISDKDTVLFLRDKLNKFEFEQIVQKFNSKQKKYITAQTTQEKK